MIDLSKIIIKADGGGVNMGVLSSGATFGETSPARFHLRDTPAFGKRFIPVWVRIHFSGTGANLADVGMYVDSWRDSSYDVLLWTEASKGLNKDVNFRIPVDELKDWVLEAQDEFVLTWTNPHPNAVMWGVVVGLLPVEKSV